MSLPTSRKRAVKQISIIFTHGYQHSLTILTDAKAGNAVPPPLANLPTPVSLADVMQAAQIETIRLNQKKPAFKPHLFLLE